MVSSLFPTHTHTHPHVIDWAHNPTIALLLNLFLCVCIPELNPVVSAALSFGSMRWANINGLKLGNLVKHERSHLLPISADLICHESSWHDRSTMDGVGGDDDDGPWTKWPEIKGDSLRLNIYFHISRLIWESFHFNHHHPPLLKPSIIAEIIIIIIRGLSP